MPGSVLSARRKVRSPLRRLWDILFFSIALIVIFADRFTKWWIEVNLAVGQSIPTSGLFRLTHVQNSGAAFGTWQGQSTILAIFAMAGGIAILLFVLFYSSHFPVLNSWLGKPALGLIFGGTVGNLIDRFQQGHVTDFIDIGIWPSFNVAASAITVGVILFAYLLLFIASRKA